jgi:uncharacterized protein YjgD (DUF1641 family)
MGKAPKLLRNEPQTELERLVTAAQDALTDTMVERLSMTAANTLEVVDRLNDEDTRDAIHYAVDRLTELHRTGGLETLFEMVTLLHAARNAATDNIVERMFAFIELMLNTVATEEMAELADNLRISVEQAAKKVERRPAKGGLISTISLLSKPETQRSLQFFMAMGESLQENRRNS